MKEEWAPKKLGSAVSLVMGQAPAGSDCNRDGIGTPFVKVGEFGDERPTFREWTTDPKKMARYSDVLICVVGATCGKINLGQDCAIGRSVAAIRPKQDKIDQRYLWYFMQGKVMEMRAGSQGAAQTVINRDMINDIDIPLPPLEEQRRIVAVLNEAFAGIATATANAQKNLTNARALFDIFLASTFFDGASDWPATTIADACTLRSGTTVNAKLEQSSGEVPYVKVADMSHYDNLSEVKTSSRFLRKSDIGKNALIPAGSTIFPKRGGAIMTNKKRLTIVPIAADLNIMAVIPGKAILSKFLRYYFENVDMKTLGSGSSIPQINNYDIEPLVIHVPNKSVQEAFVEKADTLKTETNELELLSRKKLAALTELKQSLLQKAFAGELT